MKLLKYIGCGALVVGLAVTGAWLLKGPGVVATESEESEALVPRPSPHMPEATSSEHTAQSRFDERQRRLAFLRHQAELDRIARASADQGLARQQELMRETKDLLAQATNSGKWTESQAIRLHSIHQSLGAERSEESLLTLTKLFADGTVKLDFEAMQPPTPQSE